MLSLTQNLVAVQSFDFEREHISAEFWTMQSSIGNATCDTSHVTRSNK